MAKFKTYEVIKDHEIFVEFKKGERFREFADTQRVNEEGKTFVRLLCQHGSPMWLRQEYLEEV